jgi:hypothetical protein
MEHRTTISLAAKLIEALENRLQTLAKKSERPRVNSRGLAAPLHIVVLRLFSARVPRVEPLGTNWGHPDRWRGSSAPKIFKEAYATEELVAELDSPSAGARPGRALVRFRPG